MLPPSAQRRINRLENDVLSIYEILTKHRRILDEHSAMHLSHSAKLDEHSAMHASHSAKLDKHSRILDEHSAKHDSHSEKLDEILAILRGRAG